ncbi:MAG TPA: hypothetical protein VFE48_12690 [Methylomirabilota bacterium]|nr:hypothetical protein [Methylomirabilota bacterium]
MRATRKLHGTLAALAVTALSMLAAPAVAAPVAARYQEGVTHGFLVLRGAGGEVLADGDLLQVVKPEGVDSRLVFRFRDGSLYDETVLFTQQKVFTLQRYHLIRRGPTFPEELEVTFDRKSGRYSARSRRGGDEPETASGALDLAPDVYNGMMIMLLKNLARGATLTVRTIAFMPKPLVVELQLAPVGEETVSVGERTVEATHFVMTPKLGPLRGTAAALLGKTPPNYHCWVVTTEVPAFVAIDGPLYTGGPIWRIETVSPQGPGRRPLAR